MRTNGPLQLYPLLRMALAMAAGIFVAYEWASPFPVWAWLAASAVCIAVAVACRRWAVAQGCLIMASCFFLGAFLLARQLQSLERVLPEEKTACTAVLLSEPQQKGKVVRADMQVVGGELDGLKVKASVLRDAEQRYRSLHVGQGIRALMSLQKPQNFTDSRFNYPLYLRCRGFTATAFILADEWQIEQVSLQSWSHLQRTRLVALTMRQNLLRRYLDMGIGEEEAAVAVAMTLGDRSRLTNELRDMYSMSGASHILALSGMHLGIIYMLFSFLLGFGRWTWLREMLIVVGIWAYVFLTGLSPSAVRAAVMITIYSVVSVADRNRMSLNALALAALVMWMANPLSLYDVGFQMSFMAVLAILVLYPAVFGWVDRQWLNNHRIIKWAWAMVVLSCWWAWHRSRPIISDVSQSISSSPILRLSLWPPCCFISPWLWWRVWRGRQRRHGWQNCWRWWRRGRMLLCSGFLNCPAATSSTSCSTACRCFSSMSAWRPSSSSPHVASN